MSTAISIDGPTSTPPRSLTPQVATPLDGNRHKGSTHSDNTTLATMVGIQLATCVFFVTLVVITSLAPASDETLRTFIALEHGIATLGQQFDAADGALTTGTEEIKYFTRQLERDAAVVSGATPVLEAETRMDVELQKRFEEVKKLGLKTIPDKVQRKMDDVPVPRVQAAYIQGGVVPAGVPQRYVEEAPSEPVNELPGPAYKHPNDPMDDIEDDEERNSKRREAVVDAFRHSWKGYVKHAWRQDELQPRSQDGKNWAEGSSKGIGVTVLDSLTTMYVMGLEDELEKALEFVKDDLAFTQDVEASAFESTIRMLGGLLSIYELTGEKHSYILKRAVELADRLMWAYNTSSGLPHSTVNYATHHHNSPQWAGGAAVLSEFGTVQLEMRTLSYHTGNPIYDIKATHIMDIVQARAPKDMLCPTYMSIIHYQWATDHISLGAMGDSFYEYLLKQYLLTNKTEARYKDMFIKAANGIVDKLLFHSVPSKWTYVAEFKRRDFHHKMDHLACFIAGTLAMGAHEMPDGLDKDKMMEAAAGITETCVKMYTRQKSGVSPEYVEFPGQQDFINGPGYYILRPETFEAVFYMWRLTKDQKWREMGWKMFRAIDRWCKVEEGGYSGLKEVNVGKPVRDNLQQSFWLAETLKYAFLIFADDATLDLKEWVFNTEAHPLKIRTRDPMQVWKQYEEDHGDVPWHPPVLKGIKKRTETPRMKQKRLQTRSDYKQKKDMYGEYDVEDGPIDDEAMPFEMSMLNGIKRPKSADRGARAKGGRGDGGHPVQVQRGGASHQQPQQPAYNPNADDSHEEVQPKHRKPVSPEERKKALQRAREMRKAELAGNKPKVEDSDNE